MPHTGASDATFSGIGPCVFAFVYSVIVLPFFTTGRTGSCAADAHRKTALYCRLRISLPIEN